MKKINQCSQCGRFTTKKKTLMSIDTTGINLDEPLTINGSLSMLSGLLKIVEAMITAIQRKIRNSSDTEEKTELQEKLKGWINCGTFAQKILKDFTSLRNRTSKDAKTRNITEL